MDVFIGRESDSALTCVSFEGCSERFCFDDQHASIDRPLLLKLPTIPTRLPWLLSGMLVGRYSFCDLLPGHTREASRVECFSHIMSYSILISHVEISGRKTLGLRTAASYTIVWHAIGSLLWISHVGFYQPSGFQY